MPLFPIVAWSPFLSLNSSEIFGVNDDLAELAVDEENVVVVNEVEVNEVGDIIDGVAV